MNPPLVNKEDPILIGAPGPNGQVEGIVVQHLEPSLVEVVYIQPSGKAIGENVVWKGDHWGFERSGPCGAYAMNADRLRPFAEKLRARA